MSRPLQVLGFGALAIDDIIYVDRGLSAGKGKVTKRATDHGGNVATALVAVARLGGRAGFIGWLGEDAAADPAGAELAREGVDISLAPRHAAAAPIRSVITVGPDGDRFIAYDDDVLHGTSDALPDDVLMQAPVLLIDGYATHSESVVARARALGLAVIADIEWTVGAATDRILAFADHLVLPLAFAREYTGHTDPAAILDALWSAQRSAVVLTDSERGTCLRQKGDPTRWHLPAYQVQAVDTTGAGDCFHGAYALALAEGKSPLDCVAYATAAAAISVTARGGRRGLPDNRTCRAWIAGANAPTPRPIPGCHD
ncbi:MULTISPECIES: PfkB family carbohydrate kinase [unclassified Rhizobium]|uniref:PfkB family carbohydrate kinase n=1 Tax=unclassified Rhizobium TaxID=2613769 RepID=UPI0007EAB2A8|nr:MULTISPECIES: PfkB family carbohydrate kinase [unclassified Rhizobium]ANM14587.1 carbohydrate/purine kinase protein [Rhizobium sp. N324]ANM20976.1 carbohydrate/purine kinase protein [Rhizobium sp. N541]ANM27349.1 carbohydrate/purine kinase protein [Rhizobium sp. N941]OYC99692.1 carbohydrate/purine kinase protein [Rhizobium sp. N4311]